MTRRPPPRCLPPLFAWSPLSFLPQAARSAGRLRPLPYVLKDFYEKREVMIPMRDGVRLFTVIYAPRDISKTYPFLVTRDAYGVRPYGARQLSPLGRSLRGVQQRGLHLRVPGRARALEIGKGSSSITTRM